MIEALVHAAKHNQIKTVRKLVHDAKWSAAQYRDALEVVAKRGHKKLVFLLATHGIAVAADKGDILGQPGQLSPLMCASSDGHLGTVRRLVHVGSDVNATEYILGNMPLHNAARNGHVNIVKFLLAHGATVDKKNAHAETALHLACASGQYHVARLLIQSGACIAKATAIPQGTALSLAAKSGDVRLLQLLHKGRYSQTHQRPVYNAATRGHFAALKYLLGKGHRSNIPCLIPDLVHQVCYRDGFDILEYVLECGIGIDHVTEALENLANVQDSHYVKTLELLLSHGANINCDTFDYFQTDTATLLGLEARRHQPNLFRMGELVKHGADIDQKDKNDMSPIEHACSWRDHPSLYFLLEHGADPTLVDHHCCASVPDNVARGVALVTNKLILDVALLLKPLNLPTLIVYHIYKQVMRDRPHVTLSRFAAWQILTDVKKIFLSQKQQ